MDNDITEFIGIYDADSTIVGEISYWVGARLGRTHCSLCELTHGVFTKKKEWKECSTALSVPFRTYHRNDAPVDVLEVVDSFPVVLVRRGTSLSVMLDAAELARFHGDTSVFVARLSELLR